MMESVIGTRIDAKMVKQVMQGRSASQNQAAKYVMTTHGLFFLALTNVTNTRQIFQSEQTRLSE